MHAFSLITSVSVVLKGLTPSTNHVFAQGSSATASLFFCHYHNGDLRFNREGNHFSPLDPA
ncbi:hypothetical protein CBM2587_A80007 [Cupriavidus taiwanensis]|uniref:Uncharacterized protein n=1 Tax=Cupriavidus taiwanensis TaxID=164546 RepID=A0A375BWP0_9BURK|nr:hypothetical protein CBM2587_A80007 [Cupriavidus taiwanensis]